MIEIIALILKWGVRILAVLIIGMIVGQLSVWRKLRIKGSIEIGDWVYVAYKQKRKMKERR